MPDHQFEYVQTAYSLNVGKGTRVRIRPSGGNAAGKEGTVTGANKHVLVKLDGQKHSDPWHPNDVEVL